jgi:AraC family transcriptional regulator
MQPATLDCQSTNLLVLPLTGLFAKHDGTACPMIATPSHAVFIAANKPYRITYPDGKGDTCWSLPISDELLAELTPDSSLNARSRPQDVTSCALLPPDAMATRSLLRGALAQEWCDAIELEEIGLHLAAASLCVLSRDKNKVKRRAISSKASVERAKELLSLHPEARWTLATLGRAAAQSPFHLARAFRRQVGMSIYQYLLRARLASALDAVLDSSTELAGIAMETGFASHSHLTARFRTAFGVTPSALRRAASAGSAREMRTILTALAGWRC